MYECDRVGFSECLYYTATTTRNVVAHEMSSLITSVLERYAFMNLDTNAFPRTKCNILRRGGTIPDPCRTILDRRYTGLGVLAISFLQLCLKRKSRLYR